MPRLSSPIPTVFLNGSAKGRTPVSLTVTEGVHSIRLVLDGKDPIDKRIKVDFSRVSTVRRFIEFP